MKAEREDIEKFDAYLFGEMNEEEQLLFESKLATDEEYAAEFAVHKLITEALSKEKEDRFREILGQQRQDTFIGNNTWGKKFTLVSAAVVLIGALALVFSMYREHNPIQNLAKNTNEAVNNPADEPKLDNSPFLQEEANAANESEAYGYDDNLSSTPEVEEIEDGSDLEAFDSEKSLSLDDIEMKDDKSEELDDVISTDQFLGKEEVVIAEKRLNLTPVKATSVARSDAEVTFKSNTESSSKDKAKGNESKAQALQKLMRR
jgi:hypothetical protein